MLVGPREVRLDKQDTDRNNAESKSVMRFDAGRAGEVVRLDNGFLRVPATIGSVGVLVYQKADGSTVRELRTPEELFDPASLASAEMLPVTNDHPGGSGFVDSENAQNLSVGHTGDNVRHDTENIRVSALVTDNGAIRDVDNGKRELSPGYEVKLDFSPGVHPTFGPYDAVQKQIRYNHVAIVAKGRAGPQVGLHLDSAVEVEQTPTNPSKGNTPMETIKINGVDYEVSNQAAQAYRMDQAQTQVRLDAAQGERSAVEAERDSARAELAQLKAVRADAADVDTLVQERLGLVAIAAPILNLDVAEVAKLDSADLKTKVVVAVHPALAETVAAKVQKNDSAYLEAAFDMAVQTHQSKPSEGLADVQRAAKPAPGSTAKLDSSEMTYEQLQAHSAKVRLDALEEMNTLKPLGN